MPNPEASEIEVTAWPARDAAAELADLPYARLTQRHAPAPDRRRQWMMLAVVVLAHALVVWFVWAVLRPALHRRLAGDVFSVTLLEPADTPPPPALLPPPPLAGAPAAPLVHREAISRNATRATLEGSKAPPLRLFGANGEIRLAPPSSAKSAPAYSAAGLQSSHIYNGKPLPYHPGRFNKAWAPLNETLGQKTVGRAIDKAIDKTTLKKTVTLPGGIKIQCAISPLMLLGGCSGMPPQPPPKNDDDIRLSLPPAQTLTGRKVALPASASSVPPPSAAASGR